MRPCGTVRQVALLGCGISTGWGAVHNTASVHEGASVAVFGLGAVGLAVIEAAVEAKASRIIAVDINPGKFEQATAWGATECINPNDHDEPIQQVIVGMTEWGVDFRCSAASFAYFYPGHSSNLCLKFCTTRHQLGTPAGLRIGGHSWHASK